MNVLEDLIRTKGIVVLDGGWGTEMQKQGLEYGKLPDLWNLEHPDRVAKVAASYVHAGADVILTNTFQCHPFNLALAGMADKAYEVAKAGASISRQAAGSKARVFGSLGPISRIVPRKGTSPDMLQKGYRLAARGLLDGGAEALVIETMTDLDDMTAAIHAAHEAEAPAVIVSVSPRTDQAPPGGRRVPPWDQMLAAAHKLGVQGLGLNCGGGAAHLAPLAVRLCQASKIPVWIKASAGLPRVETGVLSYPIDSRAFMKFLPPLVEAGARFIGGCCGTTPEYIQYIRVWVDEHQSNLLPV